MCRRLAPALLVALAACQRSPLPKDTVVLLVESAPETLDRRLALSSVAENVSGNLLEPGLVRIASDGRPVPDLAERFERVDGTTWLFTLRPGLHFHDGTPLVAADVAASLESLRDPRLGSPVASKYRAIQSIETPDELQVRVRLSEPDAPFLADMGIGIVPARGAAAPGRDGFGRHPIGAGPFRFVSWEDTEHLLLEANPDYYGGRPAIGHLLVKTVRDETTRALELEGGEADLAINAMSPEILPSLERMPHLRLLSTPGANTAYLMFQMGEAKLADARVRQAIAHAIDREAIVRYKFHGRATLATSLLPPGNWAHASGLPPLTHDVRLARALLADAGYGPAHPLSVVYETSTDRFRKSVALAVADQLGEAGIETKVRTLEFGTFFSDIRKGSFELASLKWVPIIEPDLLCWVFCSESVPTPKNGWVGGNRERFRDPALDALLEGARRTIDDQARRRDYDEAQRLLARALPYFVLWHEDSVAVVRDEIEGFSVSPYGFFDGLVHARRRQ
ncbi:MAG: ABC transporter substrate-binding protein [Deltaproteobacteria bacterium]